MQEESEDTKPWRQSRAKANLLKAINEGRVPREPKGQPRMTLRQIYESVDGLANYDYTKFSRRLTALRKKLKESEEPEEPKIKWANSKAKDLLASAIMRGDYDSGDGEDETPLQEIYNSIPELGLYRFSKFESRYKSLVATIAKNKSRATADKNAFDDFMSRAVVSLFSHRGYIQWQGSEAQAFMLEDIDNNLHLNPNKKEFWLSRAEYCENFPLDVFRDKIAQEIRTAKYIHTLKVKGKKKVADW